MVFTFKRIWLHLIKRLFKPKKAGAARMLTQESVPFFEVEVLTLAELDALIPKAREMTKTLTVKYSQVYAMNCDGNIYIFDRRHLLLIGIQALATYVWNKKLELWMQVQAQPCPSDLQLLFNDRFMHAQ
jgi:hypothetical protein